MVTTPKLAFTARRSPMSIETLTDTILNQMPKMPKRGRIFFSHLMKLLLSLRGRFNFINLARYGIFNEATYRYHFAKAFDRRATPFMTFNQHLVAGHCSAHRVITFDPSYLPKSGKRTAGLGYFWSGCAQRVKKGLELAGFSCVDLTYWTSLHLYAQQTVLQAGEHLMDFYIKLLQQQAKQLLKVSNILCVDAYFSKYEYVKAATECGFTVVSRLRNDAVLRYLYTGSKTGQRGRPKTYDGVVDKHNLRTDVFEQFITPQGLVAYQGVVYIKAIKLSARLVMLPQEDKKGRSKAPKLFFATDPEMTGQEVLKRYKARFQCEFLYRDAKQHTGLTQGQCRSEEKLHFHLNAALTAVSLAKVAHHLNGENQAVDHHTATVTAETSFSMADVKTQYSNQLLLNRFIDAFGIDAQQPDNYVKIKELYQIGKIAA